jgi:K+-sensing histidine kinase KdpD
VVRVAERLASNRYTELHIVHVVASDGATETHLLRLVPRVLVGSPADAISRYATEQRAHLIVMGTHGYGPVRRLLLGSVASRASCPVLTVPPRERLSCEPAPPVMDSLGGP